MTRYDWLDIMAFTLDGYKNFTVWYEEEEIGFLKDGDRILVTEDYYGVMDLVASMESTNEPTIVDYNLDIMAEELEEGPRVLGEEGIIALWNIAIDMANTLDEDYPYGLENEGLKDLYDRLFLSQNIRIFDIRGDRELPEFTGEEWEQIGEVASYSLELIRKNIEN